MTIGKIQSFALLLIIFSCTPKQSDTSDPIRKFKYEEFTINQLQKGYSTGEFSVEEVVQSYLDRIAAIDDRGPKLNSVIQINPDAIEIAKQL
ncbi:MAG: amidase, partial [Cyclobacteriaceae bacterium]